MLTYFFFVSPELWHIPTNFTVKWADEIIDVGAQLLCNKNNECSVWMPMKRSHVSFNLSGISTFVIFFYLFFVGFIGNISVIFQCTILAPLSVIISEGTNDWYSSTGCDSIIRGSESITVSLSCCSSPPFIFKWLVSSNSDYRRLAVRTEYPARCTSSFNSPSLHQGNLF